MAEHDPKSDRPWREIAEEVSTESDSDKIAELGQELIKALDKESAQRPERHNEQVRRKSA